MSTPYDQYDTGYDPLGPARGVTWGVFLGALAWAAAWGFGLIAGAATAIGLVLSLIWWLLP